MGRNQNVPQLTADEQVIFDLWVKARPNLPADEARGFDSYCRKYGIISPYRRRCDEWRDIPASDRRLDRLTVGYVAELRGGLANVAEM